ncbi:hypothetical protein CMQ_7177 [Grosmannia clavigera kw1407]|uniref:Secreted protein n=1 Tax=Grosmannia clavigera (strain kw1407 / UAMH 11150) TaxID=655863 RepID=F0XQ85_GROCL|nr:uncharacterized protein CMQ_7177 [Grosmannia clavigera kw1407]EFX00175.1 hypothetical protein CMQ_7177 [Grosmannia clavigera kw1407]
MASWPVAFLSFWAVLRPGPLPLPRPFLLWLGSTDWLHQTLRHPTSARSMRTASPSRLSLKLWEELKTEPEWHQFGQYCAAFQWPGHNHIVHLAVLVIL